MKNRITKIGYIFIMLLTIFAQSGIATAAATLSSKNVRVAGDDPGVTITAPEVISSKQRVELDVTVSYSAGKMDTDGKLKVKIPKSIVNSSVDIVNDIKIGDPFYLEDPALVDDGSGNYVLNIAIDHTKIDQTTANGATIKIFFAAPFMDAGSGQEFPDSVDFEATLSKDKNVVSTDTANSKVNVGTSGKPLLMKYATQPDAIVNGTNASIQSMTKPNANIFVIPINYNQTEIKNAKIVDTLPLDTELVDPNPHIPATGDATVINHFRIAKVTGRRADGVPIAWQYVTTQFANKITLTSSGFSIDFGDIGKDDAYVVMYAEKIQGNPTPEEFGVRKNVVTLYSDDQAVKTAQKAIALKQDDYQAVSLSKSVSQATIASKSGDMTYSLTLKNNSGDVKAGTIITDPLPEFTKFTKTESLDSNYFEEVGYDVASNTIKYRLIKDLPLNTAAKISFKVHYENLTGQSGDKIVNKASFNYAGSDIYSNDATTMLDGSAHLYKKDAATANPLAGAEFKVVDKSGQTVASGLVSDKNGLVNSGLLEPGDYQFIEVKAPTGYVLDKTPIDFTVTAGQDQAIDLTAVNKTITGSVLLTKTDDHQKALQGATFELQDQQGNVLQKDLKTDANGQIKVTDLKAGDYQFVETKAPAGYELDATPVTFTIQKNDAATVKINKINHLIPGDVLLTKTDHKDGHALQGAIFELQDKSGKTLQQGLTTDAKGQLTVKGLQPGDYQFVETKAPAGYQLDKTPQLFTIKKDQTTIAKVNVENTLTPGSVILTKVDAKDGATLQGAVFELQDSRGKTVKTNLTTDTKGQLVVKDLEPGDYQFVETQAPNGYQLDQTPQPFTIKKGDSTIAKVTVKNTMTPGSVVLTKIDAKDNSQLQGAAFELQDSQGQALQSGLTTDANGQVVIKQLAPGDYQFVETKAPAGYQLDTTPQPFTIVKGQTAAVSVKMANKLVPGDVVLTKVDQKDNTPLQGAVFKLQTKAGKTVKTGLTTDAAGKIAVSDLDPGDYQFVETKAPTGYDLEQTPVSFTISKGQTTAVKVTKNNQLTPGSVVLTKKDNQTGAVLQGAVFELRDKAGKTLQSGLTTDVTGKLAISDLDPGDYQLIETKAPTGYQLDQTPINFTIKKNQGTALQLTKTNKLTPGSVILTKVDQKDGQHLQNAVFELQTKAGKVLQSGLTTDAAGQIAIKDLDPGDYQFVETKAPTGYDLDQTPVSFTIVKDQKTAVQVTKADKLTVGGVILTKVDQKDNTPLQGAVFKLQTKAGKTVKTGLTTDAAGKIAVSDLEPGDYQLIETQAPTGYDLEQTPVSFTISKGQTTPVKVMKTNQLTKGGVLLTKTDQKSGETLQGAIFELQDQNGNSLQVGLTTDKAGQIAVSDLTPGDYQLIETKAPTGYQLDQKPVKFTIKKNQTSVIKLTKTNQLTPGSVVLTKQDQQTGTHLQGAVFELQDSQGKTLQTNLITGTTGQIAVKDLAPGDYQFVETKAPTGYDLDQTPVKFTIKKHQTTAVTVVKNNQLTAGSVILTKQDDRTGETLQNAVFSLQNQQGKTIKTGLTTDVTGQIAIKDLTPGDYQFVETKAPTGYQLDQSPVKFTIVKNQKTAIKLIKTDKVIPGSAVLTKVDKQTGETLAGAVFKLVDSHQKVIAKNLKSDAAGKIAVSNLAPGQYSFIETKAPTGYQLDSTPVNFIVTKQQPSSTAVNVQKTNQQNDHEVRLAKKDRQTGQLLAGAVFELQDEKGHVLKEQLITDQSGILVIKGLKTGDYQLVETKAPAGYQLDQTPVKFTIDHNHSSLSLVKENQKVLDPSTPALPTPPTDPVAPTKPGHSKPSDKTNSRLPQTGSTADMTILGLLVLLIAGGLYRTKRRVSRR